MARGQVLIIDDDPSVRRALARLIGAAGYEVEAVEDVAAYLAHPPITRPACLVLDIRMPRVSGLELQHAVEGSALSLPIIFITGQDDDETRAVALAAGAVDVLPKPLEERFLIEAIERALARCGGGTEVQ